MNLLDIRIWRHRLIKSDLDKRRQTRGTNETRMNQTPWISGAGFSFGNPFMLRSIPSHPRFTRYFIQRKAITSCRTRLYILLRRQRARYIVGCVEDYLQRPGTTSSEKYHHPRHNIVAAFHSVRSIPRENRDRELTSIFSRSLFYKR